MLAMLLLAALAACESPVGGDEGLLPDPFALEEGGFTATVSGDLDLDLTGAATFGPNPIVADVDEVVLRAEEWDPPWLAPSLGFSPTALLLGGPVFPFAEGTHRLGVMRPVYATLTLYVEGQLHTYLSTGGTLRIHSASDGRLAAGFSFTASRMGPGGAILGTVRVHGAFRTLPAQELP
jgi:hypothetical protein